MELKLDHTIVSKVDLLKLINELQLLSEQILASKIRQQANLSIRTSPQLNRFLEANNWQQNLDQTLIENAIRQLKRLRDHAKVVHVSFAVDPPASVVYEITKWLRDNIDSQIVLQIGLQPTIAAGIVLRTGNRQFDFSLKNQLATSKQKLIQVIYNL